MPILLKISNLMAKTISDEQMKLTMIINGNSAQKELFDLEKSTRKYNEENKALLLQKKLLEKQGKKDTDQWKLLTATIKSNSAEILNNKTRMAELQKEIGLTGLTMGQLNSKATMLRNTLRNLIPGSEDYIRYQAELTQVNSRLGELSGRSRTAQSSIGSLADTFNRYQGMAVAAIAALTGVVLSIQKIIDINGKLADAQSDVMKTTGMTKIEVDELTKSFGLLQTRTSRIDLLGIAEQGGRIGIAKAEIGDFVNVMNKASVALGDSFTGGAEEVANKLGKIKFLFEETKNLGVEESYNSIGSAINDLGANGTASEANIADFTTRIGSLTDVLKPTIQETLALGTAFEESGIESEVSARAYGIFMKQASTETAKFAKVMGLTTGQVESMINTNPLEFMLKFSEGMKGMNATDTAKTLDSLGISADGANKVIGAMGNNTARFRELIDLSNNSFATGTSLINEYELKNNNLAATLEKISKTVSGWFSSESFIKWLGGSVEWLAKFIGATEDADGNVTAWKNTLVFVAKVLAIVTAAMVTNIGWQKLVALWTTRSAEANLLYIIGAKARAFADGIGMVATQAYAMATMLMSGNLAGATQAFRVMTAAMMTTPWGFLIGALAAIGTAYILFSDNAKEAETAQSLLNQTIKDTDAIVNQQTASMKTLLAVANDETASKEAKLAAIKKLNEISPEYLKTLTLENIKTAEGKQLIDSYVKSLEKKAMLQVLQKRQSSIMEDMDKRKNMSLEEEVAWYDQAWASIKNFNNASLAGADLAITATQRKAKGLAELQNQLNLTNAEMEAFLKKNPSVIVDIATNSTGTGAGFNVPTDPKDKKGGSKKDTTKTQADIDKERLDAQLKFNELSLKNTRQLEDDRVSAMEDGYDKEMAVEGLRYKREIEDLEKQKVHGDEMAKLDVDIAKAKKDKDTKYYNFLVGLKKDWGDRNQKLDEQINDIEAGKLATHNIKLGTIQEKGAKENLQKSKEAFDQAKILRETKHNEQLAALGTNEKAKEKLRKSFALSELAEEEKFLKELVDQFNLIVGKGNFGKMDMSLLTPEQVERFTKEAAKVGLTLSELIAKKNELSGKDASTYAAALGISKATTDIFGFTPENWVQFSDNLANGKIGINEMVFAVSALTDAYGKYNEFLTANENAQLKKYTAASDAKKNKLKKQLDSGMISQTQYNKSVEKIDSDLDNKKADLEYKQAKRQRMISAANIIMSTAQAIIGIWAQFPKADFGITAGIMSGVVGTLGALQLATVLATPLPAKGYEEGLYPEYVKREQDGKTFKSRNAGKMRSGLVSKTSHFMVAENDKLEMVIDNKAWTQMDPAVKDALVRDLRGIKGFEQGYYNQDLKRYEVPAASSAPSSSSSSNNDQMMQMMMALVAENTSVLKDLRDKGVTGKFFKNDLQSAKNIQDSINDFNDLRNKAKQ
jgi:tubulin-specific chaperone A